MNTGYYDLDKIINLNNSQLIACTSADYVTEPFLSNILKNVKDKSLRCLTQSIRRF